MKHRPGRRFIRQTSSVKKDQPVPRAYPRSPALPRRQLKNASRLPSRKSNAAPLEVGIDSSHPSGTVQPDDIDADRHADRVHRNCPPEEQTFSRLETLSAEQARQALPPACGQLRPVTDCYAICLILNPQNASAFARLDRLADLEETAADEASGWSRRRFSQG